MQQQRSRFLSLPECSVEIQPECLAEELEGMLTRMHKGLLVTQATAKEAPTSLSKQNFCQFVRLPWVLATGLFGLFDQEKVSELSTQYFVDGFCKLLLGTPLQKLKLIFRLLSGGKEFLSKEACKSMVYHVAIACDCQIQGFCERESIGSEKQELSQKVLDIAIDRLFSQGQLSFAGACSLSEERFVNFSNEREADIPILVCLRQNQVLTFIYERLQLVPRLQNYLATQLPSPSSGPEHQRSGRPKIRENAQFYALNRLARIRFFRNVPFIRKLFPTLTPLQKVTTPSLFSELLLLRKPVRSASYGVKPRSSFYAREDTESCWRCHRGLVYRFMSKDVIRPFWFELRGNDLYCFKRQYSPSPKMIIPLVPGFVIDDHSDPPMISKEDGESRPLYSFDLIFPSGVKKGFLFFVPAEKRLWVAALTAIIGGFDYDVQYQIERQIDDLTQEGVSAITGQDLTIHMIPKRPTPALPPGQLEKYKASIRCHVEALKICEHPSIARLVELNETSDFFFVARERLNGGALSKYLKRPGISSQIIAGIIKQMIQILAFLNAMGIAVGNICPASFELAEYIAESDNLTIPVVKLVDLRQACFLHANLKNHSPISLYSAPQAILGAACKASDTFSLGVSLAEMLSGDLPFETEQDILKAEPIMAPLSCSGLKEAISGVIKKLLEKDPAKRLRLESAMKMVTLLL